MAGQGTRILASDFNAIQSVIANVLGTGSGSKGYGQTVTSAPVSVGDKITAVGWQQLRNDLLAARQHQTGLDESGNLTPPSTGILVRYYDEAAYSAFAALIDTNSLVCSATQGSVQTISTGTKSNWNGTITHTVTLTFANADYARYFFNSGSYIMFNASLLGFPTNDGSTLVDNDWQTLLGAMGTIAFNANSTYLVPNSGPNGANPTGNVSSAVGFYNLTTTAQTIFTKTASSYTGNQYVVNAQRNSGGNVVTFTIQFQDVDTGTHNPPYSTLEIIEGTLTSLVQMFYASGSNVSVSSAVVSGNSYLPAVTSSGP
jgi:hypothetical protein